MSGQLGHFIYKLRYKPLVFLLLLFYSNLHAEYKKYNIFISQMQHFFKSNYSIRIPPYSMIFHIGFHLAWPNTTNISNFNLHWRCTDNVLCSNNDQPYVTNGTTHSINHALAHDIWFIDVSVCWLYLIILLHYVIYNYLHAVQLNCASNLLSGEHFVSKSSVYTPKLIIFLVFYNLFTVRHQ